MEYSFRPATHDDAQTVKQVARRVITSNYTPFLGAEAVQSFIESGLADKEIDDGLARCTVMIADGGIVGFYITDGDLLHLIMVDTVRQNRGFGTMLLTHTESALFDKYDTIRLQTFKENAPAVGFYLKNGWQITAGTPVPEMDKTMLSFVKTKNG